MLFIEFTTTITHKVRLGDDGIDGVEHSVLIDADHTAAAMGSQALLIISRAGCRAAVNGITDGTHTIEKDGDND